MGRESRRSTAGRIFPSERESKRRPNRVDLLNDKPTAHCKSADRHTQRFKKLASQDRILKPYTIAGMCLRSNTHILSSHTHTHTRATQQPTPLSRTFLIAHCIAINLYRSPLCALPPPPLLCHSRAAAARRGLRREGGTADGRQTWL